MNFKIISGDFTQTEITDIKKMLKLGDEMAFKNDNSYKVVTKDLDIHTIKIGVKIHESKAMDYRYVKVLYNLNKKTS